MLTLALTSTLLVSQSTPVTGAYFQAPALQEVAKVVPGGRTILPNGRFLTPRGKRLYTGEDLWQVLVSPDGRFLVGCDDSGLVIHDLQENTRKPLPRKDVAPTGAWLPNGKLLISQGDEGSLEIIDPKTWADGEIISVKDDDRQHPYLNELVVTQDGKFAYAVDVSYQEVVTIDLTAKKVVHRTAAGRQPYAIALDESSKQIFVANIGLFNYSLIPPPAPGKGSPRGLNRPAFAFPSPESITGVNKEGRTVPGIGSPYVPDAQSIYSYSIADRKEPRVERTVKSGVLIHAPADGGKSVGGSSPNALLLHKGTLYVSNANNDTVQAFHAQTLELKQTIKLAPVPQLARLRGVIPSGMAMNKAGTRLYVCCSGLNAVAILDPNKGSVLGYSATGWFPMQIKISPDGQKLAVATQKGIGRGPRGPLGARTQEDERFGLSDMPGMIDYAPIPSDKELPSLTHQVLLNNGMLPRPVPASKVIPLVPGKPSNEIKYVVFITKENHTFDGIFGGLKGAKSEPRYAEFGRNGWIREKGVEERVPIMPNHIKLAEEFAISDNFYMEPQASGDGHRWLVGVYPSLWTTRVFYAGWNFRADNNTPGRLVSFGSDGSQIPEDYLENGSMFEHLDRNGIDFRNYGEGYELPRTDEGIMTSKSGTFYPFNHPMPKVLYDNTCFDFPAYNTNIPDIARAEWFIEDLEKNYFSKGKGLPKFINIAICNDHGAGARPNEGYPYVASYMADNDLALGRIVEFLSSRPEWRNMAIFVTQDDPGGDNDHIDRHRSFVLAISPFAKRGYVSSDHASIMSIIRTIYLVYGLGPCNMFDALATPLHDMFTERADYTPYKHVNTDPRVFVAEKAMDPNDPRFEKRLSRDFPRMDDPAFMEWLRNQPIGRGGN